ncbi:unnamed protein product [Brassicogethes aeneus]|uniref:Transcriptional adapter 1-like protein n=1 Tax=Brassicogethes aeneus TaxID=1431903 RepID=A0A9P0B0Z1_BRAAE|nr:unnamed protein product [Brassicogethes aeneus]
MSVTDLCEAQKALEKVLGEDLLDEYIAQTLKWLSFSNPITKDEFDRNVRKIFINDEQVHCHNHFILTLLKRINMNKHKIHRHENNGFEYAEYASYVQQSSPAAMPADVEYRSAAAELFMPDSGFVSSRIAISMWQNNMYGANENVTEVIIYACQMFIKNIITAMLSKKKGYKIRDGKLQYGFNQPIPNPFLKNFSNLSDHTRAPKVLVPNEDDSFIPKFKQSLDSIEQQVAFAYSCSKRRKTDNVLTVQLLYDTLRENPKILGLYSIQCVSMLKLGMQLDE